MLIKLKLIVQIKVASILYGQKLNYFFMMLNFEIVQSWSTISPLISSSTIVSSRWEFCKPDPSLESTLSDLMLFIYSVEISILRVLVLFSSIFYNGLISKIDGLFRS